MHPQLMPGRLKSLLITHCFAAAIQLGRCETVQQAMLKASNADMGDSFGAAVAISGNTVVIGAPYEDGGVGCVSPANEAEKDNSQTYAGAAYVFIVENGEWKQQAYLKACHPSAHDAFGTAVAIDGDTIVVGAPKEDDNRSGVTHGADFSVNELRSDSGAAYIFVRREGEWRQQAFLKASNPGQSDEFGDAVAISGDTVVVGAYAEDGSYWGVNQGALAEADNSAPWSGAAYVYARTSDVWSQQAYIKASNANRDDQFGRAVAISGNTVVISARLEDSNATGVNGNQANNTQPDAGAAYVFVRNGAVWAQQAYLKAPHTDWYDYFGWCVAISGNTAVIGAPGIVPGSSVFDTGAAYVFTRSGSNWSLQRELVASNPGDDDSFGVSAAVSGDSIIIGASGEASNAVGLNAATGPQTGPNNNSAFQAGAAYVFTRMNTTWSQKFYVKPHNTVSWDSFGSAVGISGSTFLATSPCQNSFVPDSGAVYAFGIATPLQQWRQVRFGNAMNTSNAADTADPDKDTVPNLVEYAFSQNPLVADAHRLPQWSSDAREWRLQFTPPTIVPDIDYSVEVSPTMSAGSWLPIPNGRVAPDFDFRIPIGEPNQFSRLRVSVR